MNKWIKFSMVGVAMVGLAGFSTQHVKSNENGTQVVKAAARASSAQSSEKLTYHSVDYIDLASDTASYQQKRLAVSGTVMQVIHNDNANGFVLAMNGDQTRPIMVEYTASHLNGTNVVEGEAVSVKGYGAGAAIYNMKHGETRIPVLASNGVTDNNQ
ncbi:hypothetical protein [Loigolactobacillus bifermentans]|uniref:Uncharacterized protein n=1 Tax=Loigolactobacillus bifermentans DSM 20003 TaxID=1423726 RepID=A0A0R1GKJ4_9LACO|nr:hypothetical protein [Loigolactobacillus bifermentans]KRK34539.1 hypothetical protein FC07_GL000553 [Loigolactobacillus bifermentans DSM 20003]QGG61315.1 hypothetical protein LB003_13030 [Loigolactobacillus bifermentans]